MLSQLKADLARLENQCSVDDLIMESVSMEAIHESFMDDNLEFDISTLELGDDIIDNLEKVVEDIPEYTTESDMNNKIRNILENFIPDNIDSWGEV